MYTLYFGNKNYSTWSLRAWVLMKAFGIPFEEHRITLYEPDSPERIRVHSPSGKVPCLRDGSTIVFESEVFLGHDTDLWTVSRRGGPAVRYSSFEWNERTPSW